MLRWDPPRADGIVSLVRSVRWRPSIELLRTEDPLSAVFLGEGAIQGWECRDAPLPADELARRLDALRALDLPAFGDSEPTGFDGETVGLETYRGFGIRRLTWWCDGPGEWRTLVEWFAAFEAFLEKAPAGASKDARE